LRFQSFKHEPHWCEIEPGLILWLSQQQQLDAHLLEDGAIYDVEFLPAPVQPEVWSKGNFLHIVVGVLEFLLVFGSCPIDKTSHKEMTPDA